ncbi:hypothetical protein BOX15_Mlig010148g2 [Macrostomum lignano]|uniref:Uncharacterized protein n=1 Tax=Macrostomum lignano TaxID=282301 RepID=A0A267DV33_9PLAT|nr:hypothetical protein BOX15_Mlig010148g3 [Macrostomum lignano]PAA69564.1 hypothetical protein BOX15_Mlig010148g1 [Macrostomum lignano]PAA93451.1 hypothetical protein BOX15_Mlig010148g2 [Macrostomum lignano]
MSSNISKLLLTFMALSFMTLGSPAPHCENTKDINKFLTDLDTACFSFFKIHECRYYVYKISVYFDLRKVNSVMKHHYPFDSYQTFNQSRKKLLQSCRSGWWDNSELNQQNCNCGNMYRVLTSPLVVKSFIPAGLNNFDDQQRKNLYFELCYYLAMRHYVLVTDNANTGGVMCDDHQHTS